MVLLSVNNRTGHHPQLHEAAELQQAVPCNLNRVNAENVIELELTPIFEIVKNGSRFVLVICMFVA